MKSFKQLRTLVLAIFLFEVSYSQSPGENAPNPYSVSTYECAGVYWKTPESGACKIKYKEIQDNTWKDGLELVYDARHNEYRGSIINLVPNTEYQVELSNNSAKTQLNLKTRNDVFPIGKTTILPEGETDKTIVITESGTPDAYHLVTVPVDSKSVLNIKNVYDHGIEVDADYVVIRGVEIRNPRIHGILIKQERHDIVIEQCYFTFWGRIGGPKTYGNFEGNTDSGVSAESGTWNLTIQRNLMEDPRGAANDWETGHPTGPQGISISQSLGGNVIRYNDIVSTEDHGFNDAIGGDRNFSDVGNVNRDSDVYGNFIRSVWDDAIEVEGANMNVRIWGNYLDKYFVGVATASTTFGPIYIYRNIFAESRRGHRNSNGGTMFKLGGREQFQGGRRYFFHNTAVQPDGPFNSVGKCVNCVARNNIFHVPGNSSDPRDPDPATDFDYNFGGPIREDHAISFNASGRLFVSSYKLEFYPRLWINSVIYGRHEFDFGGVTRGIAGPVLNIKNPLIDSGLIIPGFNSDFKGAAPDLGAFEVGNMPLEYGRRAYLSFDEGWAAWEKF